MCACNASVQPPTAGVVVFTMRRALPRSSAARSRRLTAGAVLVLALAPLPALAQTAPGDERPDTDVCFGFSFGPWTPPLDWQLAGHGAAVDSSRVARAPGGRGWAASSAQSSADTSLMPIGRAHV